MRVRLRPGTTIDQAVMLLDRLAVNVSGEVHRPARTVEELRYSYVGWASSAERELLGVLARSDVSRIFENSRHRDICSSASSVGGHLRVLISDEVTAKSAELREIASELKAARDGMRRAPGCPTIIDTNVLLECNRPDQVKWASIVEHGSFFRSESSRKSTPRNTPATIGYRARPARSSGGLSGC